MIIFIQHRSHHHKTLSVPNEACPLCHEKEKLKLHIMQKYHWIIGPMTPLPKYGVLECDACNETIPNKNWTNTLDAIYTKEKAKVKTPARMWRGMWVIPSFYLVVFFLVSFFTNGKSYNIRKEENTLLLLQNISQNSIIIAGLYDKLKNDNSIYTHNLMKVQRISGDSIFLNSYKNSMSLESLESLNKRDINFDLFTTESVIVSLSKLKQNSTLIKLDENPSNIYGIVKSIK